MTTKTIESVFTLPAGTVVKIEGIPVSLVEETKISTHPNNLDLIKRLSSEPRCGVSSHHSNPSKDSDDSAY